MAEVGNKSVDVKRVVLVDDHPIVRDGLKQMIEQHPALLVCGEAGGAEDAIRVVAAENPDLVLVDVFLDGVNGIELTKLLCEQHPQIRILVLSMHDETLYAERAIRAGARGYVMKQEASRTILSAMETVLSGGIYVSDAIQSVLGDVAGDTGPMDFAAIGELLSAREQALLEAIGDGLDRSRIADRMSISIKTVETHRANIKYKLNIGSAAALSEGAKVWLRYKREHR